MARKNGENGAQARPVKLNLYLDDDLDAAVREACARSNQSVTDLLQPFIRRHLKEILAVKSPKTMRLRPGRKLQQP